MIELSFFMYMYIAKLLKPAIFARALGANTKKKNAIFCRFAGARRGKNQKLRRGTHGQHKNCRVQ